MVAESSATCLTHTMDSAISICFRGISISSFHYARNPRWLLNTNHSCLEMIFRGSLGYISNFLVYLHMFQMFYVATAITTRKTRWLIY